MSSKPCLIAALTVVASCADARGREEIATSGTLTLVREKNLADLLPADMRYEASGVALHGGSLRIVFDDSTRVADVDPGLSSAVLGPGSKSASQYEGITVATSPAPKTYVVKEGAGGRGAIVTVDDQGTVLSNEPTDIDFAGSDKGLEGIAWLDDVERLLVLCEANGCGRPGPAAEHGLIKSLRHEPGSWVTETTLELPAQAAFDDYSDLALLPEGDGRHRLAVLSQESAAVWIGVLTTKPLALSSPGIVYGFPKAAGKTQYCSLEGIAFLDPTTVALVSDRSKSHGGCTKAEAVHIFALP